MLENQDIKKLVNETMKDVRNEDGTFDTEKIEEMFTLYYELVCNTVLVYDDITAGEITDPHEPYTQVIKSCRKYFDTINHSYSFDLFDDGLEDISEEDIH